MTKTDIAARDILLRTLAVYRCKARRETIERDKALAIAADRSIWVKASHRHAAEISNTLKEKFGVENPEGEADALGDIWQVAP